MGVNDLRSLGEAQTRGEIHLLPQMRDMQAPLFQK